MKKKTNEDIDYDEIDIFSRAELIVHLEKRIKWDKEGKWCADQSWHANRLKRGIKKIKDVKKNPRTREELKKWYSLFDAMSTDFKCCNSIPIMDMGNIGMSIMNEMYGKVLWKRKR